MSEDVHGEAYANWRLCSNGHPAYKFYAKETCPVCHTKPGPPKPQDEGKAEFIEKRHDPVNSPRHYTGHPSGIECIEITRHMNFNCGNAMKYIWRADLKGSSIEDLRKACWYIEDEIKRRGGV